MQIVEFQPELRDDMIFMVLEAKDALGRVPKLNEDLLDVQRHYLARGEGFWLALDERGRVIGCIGTQTEGDVLTLKRLYVKKDHKRQGIGSCLLETAEQFAADRGVRTIRVHLGERPTYDESYAFYPARGYVLTAPRQMEKRLKGDERP